jgi:anaerobic selenocysteine-containing dehydrogenase
MDTHRAVGTAMYSAEAIGGDGTRPSICRLCLAYCPIDVTVHGGRVAAVAGNRGGTPYDGYTCPKGRALPEQHNDPGRLLRPIKRSNDGFATIPSRQAVDEVAAQLRAIVDRHGPDAVAYYIGTGVVSNPTGQGVGHSFFRALGSKMLFSAASIDKPAANISTALHGNWVAGAHRIEDADTWLLVGGNPVIAKSNGAPPNNPAKRLKDLVANGLKLIVIDPRRTETAKRAHIHLQARAGEDPAMLAGLLHIIIEEGFADADFVAAHARGLEELRQAVRPFTPAYVAARADVPVEHLLEAARTFARGRIGGAVCSTGPSFSTHGNLSFYLALCLNTVCGRWPRAGEHAPFPNILLPKYTPKAQAYPPYPIFGDAVLQTTGLRQNASGMPTGGLADQILGKGPGQIKALFCIGGNPVLSWPDQLRTERAMAELELLVVFDYKLTATGEFAHYVVPPPLTLEIAGNTQMVEWLKYIGVTRGLSIPWAQHTPAIVAPPAGSDLIDDGAFFFRLAQALGLQLDLTFAAGHGPHVEAPPRTIALDMRGEPPSVEQLLDIGARGSRKPLDDVKRYPGGHLFEDLEVIVAPADADNTARLELADPLMMAELAQVLDEGLRKGTESAEFPLTLICRRANNFMNSMGQGLPSLSRGDAHNPIHAHPADMAARGLAEGQIARLRSAHGFVSGAVRADETLRPGTLSLTHGFGGVSMGGKAADRGASIVCLRRRPSALIW